MWHSLWGDFERNFTKFSLFTFLTHSATVQNQNIKKYSQEKRKKKLRMEVEVEEEISNSSSILAKVAEMYATQLMSDIILIVGEIK